MGCRDSVIAYCGKSEGCGQIASKIKVSPHFCAFTNGKQAMKLINALLISLCVSGVSLLYSGNVSAKDSDSLTLKNSASIAPAMTIALQPIAQAKPSLAVLALDSQGLRVVNASTGASRAIAFGTKEADVVSILTNVR